MFELKATIKPSKNMFLVEYIQEKLQILEKTEQILKKTKKTQKTRTQVGFFRWAFLGFFGWVFSVPTLVTTICTS